MRTKNYTKAEVNEQLKKKLGDDLYARYAFHFRRMQVPELNAVLNAIACFHKLRWEHRGTLIGLLKELNKR